MLNLRDTGPLLPQTGRGIALLKAVNEAAATFQRSAHSEAAVFRAYREQMAKLELRGGLCLLDETETKLTIQVVNYAGGIGQLLNKLENLIGLRTEKFTFNYEDVAAYRQVVESGLTHYVEDSSNVIAQMLPQQAQRYLGRIVTAFGAQPAIYAPLISDGQVRGVINVVGADITPADMPALTAFANHIAVALENARLFEETRQRTEELEQLAHISTDLRLATGRSEILTLVLNQASQLLRGDGAAIAVVQEDETSLVIERGCGTLAQMTGELIPADREHFCLEVMATHKPYTGQLVTQSDKPEAVVCVPLLTHDQSIGALWVVRERAISEKAIGLLTAVADMAAVTIYRATLHDRLSQYANELERRVTERTQELAAANERLQELDELKSQLISDVSHELRTPLTTLELYLDLLNQGKPKKRSRYLKVITEQVHRLKQLVEDILDLSRLEAGRDKIEFAPVQLNEVVGQIVALQQVRAEEKGLSLRFTPDEGLPVIHGIRSQFSQVVVNLVTNSINYTKTGEVHIRTQWSEEKAQVCLQVSDTGCGIQPEELPYLYDRFFRGRDHRQGQIPGTGLGLAIVKDIVDIHDGEIEVESNVGQGTTFRIWLPVLSKPSLEPGIL